MEREKLVMLALQLRQCSCSIDTLRLLQRIKKQVNAALHEHTACLPMGHFERLPLELIFRIADECFLDDHSRVPPFLAGQAAEAWCQYTYERMGGLMLRPKSYVQLVQSLLASEEYQQYATWRSLLYWGIVKRSPFFLQLFLVLSEPEDVVISLADMSKIVLHLQCEDELLLHLLTLKDFDPCFSLGALLFSGAHFSDSVLSAYFGCIKQCYEGGASFIVLNPFVVSFAQARINMATWTLFCTSVFGGTAIRRDCFVPNLLCLLQWHHCAQKKDKEDATTALRIFVECCWDQTPISQSELLDSAKNTPILRMFPKSHLLNAIRAAPEPACKLLPLPLTLTQTNE